jgi:Skp family chaperone for outer membrane proteins
MSTPARLLTTAVVLLLTPLAALAQTPSRADLQPPVAFRVACFSPQRAFSESADGKAVIARLTVLQNEKAREIDEKNKALQAREQALAQSASLLSESARAERTNEVQKFRVDVQRFIEDAQAELLRIQRDAENAFTVKLEPALTKVAQDKGLQMVFNVDEGAVAWFDPSLDITSDVVRQLALK